MSLKYHCVRPGIAQLALTVIAVLAILVSGCARTVSGNEQYLGPLPEPARGEAAALLDKYGLHAAAQSSSGVTITIQPGIGTDGLESMAHAIGLNVLVAVGKVSQGFTVPLGERWQSQVKPESDSGPTSAQFLVEGGHVVLAVLHREGLAGGITALNDKRGLLPPGK